jgi:hypothetical protein
VVSRRLSETRQEELYSSNTLPRTTIYAGTNKLGSGYPLPVLLVQFQC